MSTIRAVIAITRIIQSMGGFDSMVKGRMHFRGKRYISVGD